MEGQMGGPSREGMGEYRDENESPGIDSVISSFTLCMMSFNPLCLFCLWFAIILRLCSLNLFLSFASILERYEVSAKEDRRSRLYFFLICFGLSATKTREVAVFF